jgi:hypothetical protein
LMLTSRCLLEFQMKFFPMLTNQVLSDIIGEGKL